MTSFTERLDYLLKKFGATHSEILKKTGVSSGNLSSYKSGRVKPSFDAIIALSNFFNVSTDWLLKGTGPGPDSPVSGSIPVYGDIASGVEILTKDIASSFIQLPDGVPADFACQVTDDNLKYAGIANGDIAFFRRTETAETGQVVAVHQINIAGNISLQFFSKKNGQACLRSANPNYEDIPLTPHHHTDGVLIALLKKQIPSLDDYENFLLYKNDTDNAWSEITTLALTNGIPAKFVKQLIEMQITMSQSIPKRNEKE